jgi:Flp pilus assembly protein TadD
MPYRTRDALDEILTWCDAPSGSLFFLLLGPTLSGKTRLTYQLAVKLRERKEPPAWRILKLLPGHEAEAWKAIEDSPDQFLLVVELAEANPGQLTTFLDAIAADSLHTRVLLVGRNPAAVPRANNPKAREKLQNAKHLKRGALPYPATDDDLRRWFGEAVDAYSTKRKTVPLAVRWNRIPDDHIGIENVRALAATYGNSNWVTLLARQELDAKDVGDEAIDCFTVAWVIDARTRDEIKKLADKIDHDSAKETVAALTHCYCVGDRTDIRFPSDLISAAIAVPRLVEKPSLLQVASDWLMDSQPFVSVGAARAAGRLLAVAAYVPKAEDAASQLLTATGRQINSADIIALVAQTPSTALADRILATQIERMPVTELDMLENLISELVAAHFNHAELAARRRAVTCCEQLAHDNHGTYDPKLAMSLDAYATSLAENGRMKEALETAHRAVDILDRLADENPGAYDHDLALSLDTYAASLAENGRLKEALEPTQRAVTLYERLAHDNPGAYENYLAGSLHNYAVRLSENGRLKEALEPIHRAVTLYERLAHDNPGAYENDLAGSLHNYANRLFENGRLKEALEAAQRAVTIREQLARENPGAYDNYLAGSLDTYANRLSENGRLKEALEPAQRAVTLYERLASENPGAYENYLAMSLDTYAVRLSENGRLKEALEPTQRAVTLYERLAHDNPGAYENYLATSLNNYANRLSENGKLEEALEPAQRAVTIREQLARENPGAYENYLAMSLHNYAGRLSENGKLEEALEPAQRAVTLYERLASENPGAYENYLAVSLHNYILFLTEAGRSEEAAQVRLTHRRPNRPN